MILLAVALAAAWLNRKALVREALTGWLRGRGIPSETEVKAFGPTRFRARLRIGPADNPDFTAEDAEVGYRLTVHGIEVTSVRLQRPVLRASFHHGRFSVGSLDPVVREFLSRPPRPNAPKPQITVDNGRLFLASDYGPLTLTADAVVSEGRLQRLAAVSAPARLRGPDFAADLGQTSINLVTRGNRVELRLDTPVASAEARDAQVRQGEAHLTLQAPYPDLGKGRLDGQVTASARLSAVAAEIGDRRLERATLTASLQGAAKGGAADLSFAGGGSGDLNAAAATGFGARAGALKVSATAEEARWTRAGGDQASGKLALNASGEAVTAGDLSFSTLSLAARGPVAFGAEGFRGYLAASASGHGAWSGLGPPQALDAPSLVALKRLARGFDLSAPAVNLAFRDTGPSLSLPRPVRVAGANGAHAVLTGRDGKAAFGPEGGAFRLTAGGGGLPSLDADVARLDITHGRALASGRWRAAEVSFGPVRDGHVDAAGALEVAGGRVTFAASRCIEAGAPRLEFGANEVVDVSGRFCAAGGPMLSLADGGWRVQGQARDVSAAMPFLQARASGGEGLVTASGRGAKLAADVTVRTARVTDTAPAGRFNPLLAEGRARLTGDVWRADIDFRLPDGPHVAHAHLVHDSLTGGGVEIATGDLVFHEGGLQPIDLSPLAAAIGTPAVGHARFEGRYDWTAQGVTSSGRLAVAGLDFRSPAGQVHGLSGELTLTSLAPLAAEPGQTMHIERLDAVVPVTDITARFGLAAEALQVQGGEASVGGGTVKVERLDIPFAAGAPIDGVLLFEGVQLHDIVEASPFGDRVELDARVSGRVPFTAAGSHIRVMGGELKAVAPGRLSIDKAALTGVQAAGAMAAPGVAEPVSPNDTFTDFAYQAMEHLAFDSLDASIATRDDGRLGVLFHIVGKFDPPKRQQLRLPIWDLIQRKFLGRKLPLPSGTGVNLTLDTSLNLDDLLSDYADYRRLHGSGPVQP